MSCQAAIQPKPSTSTAVEIVDLDHYEPTIAIDNDTSTSVTGQNGAVPPLQLNLPLPATGRVGRSSPDTATAPDIDNGGLTFVNGYNPNREKKRRQIINRQQLEVLHAEFLKNNLPEKNARLALANKLNIPERQIAIWFQNKRKSVRERGLEAAFAVRTPAPPNPSRSQIPQNVSRSNPVRRQSQKENRQPSPAPPRQSHVHTAPAPLPNPSMPTTASIASTLADPSNSLLTSILTAYFKASMTTSAARLQAGPRPPLADISQQFAMSGSRTPIRRPQSQDVIDVTSPEQPPRPSLPEAPIILDSPPQQNNNLRSSRYITRSILSTPPRRHTSSHRTALHRTSPIQRRADVSPSFSDIFSPSDLDNPAFAGALRQTDFLSASSPPRRSTHRQRDTRQPQSSIGISRPLDRPSKTSLKRTRSPENVIVIDEDLLNSPTRRVCSKRPKLTLTDADDKENQPPGSEIVDLMSSPGRLEDTHCNPQSPRLDEHDVHEQLDQDWSWILDSPGRRRHLRCESEDGHDDLEFGEHSSSDTGQDWSDLASSSVGALDNLFGDEYDFEVEGDEDTRELLESEGRFDQGLDAFLDWTEPMGITDVTGGLLNFQDGEGAMAHQEEPRAHGLVSDTGNAENIDSLLQPPDLGALLSTSPAHPSTPSAKLADALFGAPSVETSPTAVNNSHLDSLMNDFTVGLEKSPAPSGSFLGDEELLFSEFDPLPNDFMNDKWATPLNSDPHAPSASFGHGHGVGAASNCVQSSLF